MEEKHDKDEVTPSVVILRIIIFSLITGVLMYAVVIVFFIQPEEPPEGSHLALILAGFAVVMIAPRAIVPAIIVSAARRRLMQGTWRNTGGQSAHRVPQTDAGRLIETYMTSSIVAGALMEGPAFANLVAYQIERQPYSLVVAGLLVVGIAFLFPIRTVVDGWIERQLRRINEERSLAGLDK